MGYYVILQEPCQQLLWDYQLVFEPISGNWYLSVHCCLQFGKGHPIHWKSLGRRYLGLNLLNVVIIGLSPCNLFQSAG